MARDPARRTPADVRASRAPHFDEGLDGRRRAIVEHVLPEIDGGRFPIKRTVGEHVEVTAHAHADGHDVLVVRLCHRPGGDSSRPWTEVPMEALGNDEWRASFRVDQLGRHEYTVLAWVDRFLTWRRGLAIKAAVGTHDDVDIAEGARLVEAAARRASAAAAAPRSRRPYVPWAPPTPPDEEDRGALARAAMTLESDAPLPVRTAAALDEDLVERMARYADRQLAAFYHRTLDVVVDRERARFGAWYEMFPRSWGPTSERSGTLVEAAAHLGNVAALGFDVVYLPPIHPIGASFRKGRHNALQAGPGDPGSPWAIGSPDGGHKAVEPSLGTVQDFIAFVRAANDVGLEVALDLAFQCSPDHPYVQEHPEWFRHRSDGSIQYAENPPKKYQDIYPFDFESTDWRALWDELLSVVQCWIDRGVRIFRVDNPHTKPYRFWEWLIERVHQRHPDVVFLAEAFTRPKVMGYLAKLGFTQSYSYFTWRNTKAELEQYFGELTGTELREYFRPNLFANTPDILHAYLQEGGPPAFRIRLVLAATLGASYGIYSGFELCEGRGVPGTEEYFDSEKYAIRQWDWDRPGHIKDMVAAVNRIRREHRALHFDRGLRFHATDNPDLVAYSKATPEGDRPVLIVVSLDPGNVQHGWIQVSAGDLGLETDGPFEVADLLSGGTFTWTGDRHYVRLDPERPAHILVPSARRRGDV